ncbi:MAG TPA: SDR family NAD(P)-dependent oxidoreductase [Anaerolineales bacterium]
MPQSLQNNVVLITGASSGFGAEAARLFAREGCIVVLAARRMDRLTALAEEIHLAGGQAFAVPLDVTEQPQIDNAVQTVLDTYGRIDILLNNAGVGSLNWLEMLDPAADIDMQIDVNLRGVLQVTRAVLPSMLARRAGHIINMSSVAGLIAAPMYSIYAATKYGLRGFTDALRREVAPLGIHVSGIYPGPATTEFGQHSGDNPLKRNIKVPRWIYMTSEYVAHRTVSLARHPRRTLVIPWWFRPVIGFDTLFPGLVDWFLKVAFVKRLHRLTEDDRP